MDWMYSSSKKKRGWWKGPPPPLAGGRHKAYQKDRGRRAWSHKSIHKQERESKGPVVVCAFYLDKAKHTFFLLWLLRCGCDGPLSVPLFPPPPPPAMSCASCHGRRSSLSAPSCMHALPTVHVPTTKASKGREWAPSPRAKKIPPGPPPPNNHYSGRSASSFEHLYHPGHDHDPVAGRHTTMGRSREQFPNPPRFPSGGVQRLRCLPALHALSPWGGTAAWWRPWRREASDLKISLSHGGVRQT